MIDHKRIEKLMLFVEVANTLNFSKAADNLGISKSYLSEQIKRLEQELHTPLIVRTTRSVRLTAEGMSVLAQAEDIKRRVTELERNLNQQSQDVSGLIRITAPKMFSETWLHDICGQFREHYPEVDFEILSSYQAYNLSETMIDVAFRATLTPPENMIAYKLFDYHHLLIASPNYLKQHGVPQNTDDLLQHQCLRTSNQKTWPLKSSDIAINGWLTSNENRLLKEAALNGQGIVRIASYFVEKDIAANRLTSVLPDETSYHHNSMFLIYPQLVHQSAKMKAFLSFVKAYFARH